MKKLKNKIIIIIITLFIGITSVFADYNELTKYESIFDKLGNNKMFSSELNTKYTMGELDKMKNKIPEEKLILLEGLRMLGEYKIAYYRIKQEINSISKPSFLSKTNFKFYKVNKNFEFIENKKVKKLDFREYYDIDDVTYRYYINNKDFNNSIIINEKGQYKLVKNYKILIKEPLYKLSNFSKGFVSKDRPSIIENGNYYNITYKNYYSLGDIKDGFYKENTYSGNDIKDLIFMKKNDGELIYIVNYTLNKVIGGEFIKSLLTHKDYVIKLLSERVNHYDSGVYNTEEIMGKIKDKTLELIEGKETKDEKIKAIYMFILEHLQYDQVGLDAHYKPVFSAISSYEREKGVCDAYTRLFVYMLSFAGIEDDIEIKIGYIINEENLTDWSHAWVKVGNYYYDPTFDDPIGNVKTREFANLLYYKIPESLMYANKTDGIEIPESIKNMTFGERKKFVEKRYYNLAKIDTNKNYNLVKPFLAMKYLNIKPGEEITLEKIKPKIKYGEYDGVFLTVKGEKVSASSMKYFLLEDDFSNFFELVKSSNKTMNELLLIKWLNFNGKSEYRLVYELDK